MIFNPSETKQAANEIANSTIEKSSVVISDKASNYVDFNTIFDNHITIKSNDSECIQTFGWINTSISNLKRFLLGIYHGVNEKYLQNYRNEFCFKLNHRNRPQILELLLLKLF